MKNRFRKLAAVLGVAVLVTSQGGVLPVHAEEAAATSQNSSVQPVSNVWLGSDGNVYFSDPNNGVNAGFSGILTFPNGEKMDYYYWDGDGSFFYTFEYIEDAGDYSFVVRTHDTANGWQIVGEKEYTWTYSRPSSELAAPEDVVWAEDGILTFKEVADAKQYSFNVYDSQGNNIYMSFGSNVLGNFMKKADGYVKINLSGYLHMEGVTAGNGCYVTVRATSTDINTTAHGAWVASNPLKSNNATTTKSSKSSGTKSCSHEYEWVSEREATQIANGEEIYQCKYCGDVKERMEMANSAYAKFNKDAISAIDKAQVNGTVTLKTDMWVSFYASVIDTLKARPDVTLVVNYFYQGVRYTMTIPAGADLSALVDSEGYYGFRYLDLFFPGQEVK